MDTPTVRPPNTQGAAVWRVSSMTRRSPVPMAPTPRVHVLTFFCLAAYSRLKPAPTMFTGGGMEWPKPWACNSSEGPKS